MAVTSVKKNKFKIILTNPHGEKLDVDYLLDDSYIAKKWSQKIKHLQRVSHDPVESDLTDVSDLDGIYKQFCEFADIQKIDTEDFNQQVLNDLHKIYEQQHDKLSQKENNYILYKFHHSIHKNEKTKETAENINVGWGVKEGPLTNRFNCHSYYTDSLKKNQIYLPWAELGKKPLDYYRDKEPNIQQRFNQLSKPHVTFRAKFFINLKDITTPVFETDFTKWFSLYKESWFETYGIDNFEEKHQYSAPILGHTDCKENLNGFMFDKIIV